MRLIEFEGREFEFPADATDDEIAGVLETVGNPPAAPSVAAATAPDSMTIGAGLDLQPPTAPPTQAAKPPPQQAGGDAPGALSRGFVSGLMQQNPETMGEALEGLGRVTGWDALGSGANDLRAVAKLSPEAYQPRAKSIWDAGSVDDALTWAGETMGQGFASTVPSLVTGIAGGAIGQRLAGKAGATVGALGGAAVPSAALNYGEVYKALKDEGVDPDRAAQAAVYASVPITALDTASLAPIISRFGMAGVRQEITRSVARRVAAEMGKGAGREGLTEAAQAAIKQATVSLETGKSFFTIENAKTIAEEGLGGVLVGGPMSGVAGAVPQRHAAPRPTEAAPPNVTAADVGSPIPTDLISEGRSIMAGEGASPSPGPLVPDGAVPAGLLLGEEAAPPAAAPALAQDMAPAAERPAAPAAPPGPVTAPEPASAIAAPVAAEALARQDAKPVPEFAPEPAPLVTAALPAPSTSPEPAATPHDAALAAAAGEATPGRWSQQIPADEQKAIAARLGISADALARALDGVDRQDGATPPAAPLPAPEHSPASDAALSPADPIIPPEPVNTGRYNLTRAAADEAMRGRWLHRIPAGEQQDIAAGFGLGVDEFARALDDVGYRAGEAPRAAATEPAPPPEPAAPHAAIEPQPPADLPAPILNRANGKPFETAKSAALGAWANLDLRDQGLVPIKVKGGWGLVPKATPEPVVVAPVAPEPSAPAAPPSSVPLTRARAKAEALRQFDEAATTPVAIWKGTANAAREAGRKAVEANRAAKASGGGYHYGLGWEDGLTGTVDEQWRDLPHYRQGWSAAQQWAAENPRPDGDGTVSVTTRTSTGHETRFTLNADADAIRGVRKRVEKLPLSRFQMRPSTDTLRLSPAFDRSVEGIAGDLRTRLERAGIEDRIDLRLVDAIRTRRDRVLEDGEVIPAGTEIPGAAGRYVDQVIEVALASPDRLQTLGHEMVHALRDLGVLRPAEWRILERAAQNNPMMARIRRDYAGLNLSDEAITEEVVAEMFGDWMAGQPAPHSFARRSFERIRDFFQALGNALRGYGFTTPNMVFRAIERGDVGRRGRVDEAGAREAEAFQALPDDARRFSRDLDLFLRGELPPKRMLTLGRTPAVLQALGAQDVPLRVSQKVLRKVAVEKHSVHTDTLARLPELLADPVMVFDSATQPGSLVAVLNATEIGGEPLIAAIHLASGEISFNSVASVYGQRQSWFERQINDGRLRYVHTENAPAWLRRIGLQLPKWKPVQGRGDRRDVLTQADIVKGERLSVQNAPDRNRGTVGRLSAFPGVASEEAVDPLGMVGDRPASENIDPEDPDAKRGNQGMDAVGEHPAAPADERLNARRLDALADKEITPDGSNANPDPAEKFSLRPGEPDPTDPRQPGSAEARKGLMLRLLESQPIDRAMRVPFDIFGGVNERGEWKPGLYLHDKAARIITEAEFGGVLGPLAWMNPALRKARAGLVDRYGLDPAYVERDRQRGLDERRITAKVPDLLRSLAGQGLQPQEMATLHDVLTGEAVPDGRWLTIALPIREAIDQMGAEAVDLGLLSAEAYERNRGKYLHRVYLKHEADMGGLSRWASNLMARRRQKIQGDQFKGRGMFLEVSGSTLEQDGAAAQPGQRFTILDKVEEGEDGTKRVTHRAYLPDGTPVPGDYQGYTAQGTWEVRGTKGGKVVLWRDFTKAERARMGEIVDARYGIAKTYMMMAHDLSTGRFFRDIAANPEWSRAEEPADGTWAEAADYNRRWADGDVAWVQVPDTMIPKSRTKRYGALAGRFVRAEIWRDMAELESLNKPTFWDAVMREWKLNKTARNPVVHMNNIMSNVVFMDLADVRAADLARAVHALVKEDAVYREAVDNGAFGADMVAAEIRRDVLQPILDEMAKTAQGGKGGSGNLFGDAVRGGLAGAAIGGAIGGAVGFGPEGMAAGGVLGAAVGIANSFGVAGKLAHGLFSRIKAADQAMTKAYQMEDEVFRMALYLRRREQGLGAEQAALEARDHFMNYDIRAPWVNAARRTALPFITYTYRAVPVIAKSIAHRPWKLAKYATMAYAFNALSYAFLGLDDEDEDKERRSLREEEQGRTWIGLPRMLRLPMNDKFGNPLFLDIRRWIPGGDTFDLSQGQSAIPLFPFLQPGGPLAIAAELFLNRQAFNGQDITNRLTDTGMDRAESVGSYLWKAWMPSAAWIPGSWYWDRIGDAINGVREPYTDRPYSLPQAVASSVGIKVKPQDVEAGFTRWALAFRKEEEALKLEARKLARDRERGAITQRAFESEMAALFRKRETMGVRMREVFGR